MGFSMLGAMGDYMAEKPREIVKIDLDDLLDDKNNDFEVEGGTGIEKKNALLKDSIEQFGLLEPCTVRPAGGGKYTLISGHRRKLMHRRLVEEGKTEFQKVDCIIREADDNDAEQMLVEANIPNRDISDWEKARAVERLNAVFERREQAGEKIPGRRREHIAAALGISTSAVGRLENINKNLTPEYKEELKAGNIGVTVADKLASKPQEKQKEIHNTKGAKVKLYDLAEEKRMPLENKIRLQGIPEKAGVLFVIIGEFDGKYYAGFSGIIHKDGSTYPMEKIDEEQKYLTYDGAWDGAMEMIKANKQAAALLEEKAPQEAPGEVEQPDEPDQDYMAARTYAAKRVLDRLEHFQKNEAELAKIDQQEENREGQTNHQAAADYLAELIDQVKDDIERLRG